MSPAAGAAAAGISAAGRSAAAAFSADAPAAPVTSAAGTAGAARPAPASAAGGVRRLLADRRGAALRPGAAAGREIVASGVPVRARFVYRLVDRLHVTLSIL